MEVGIACKWLRVLRKGWDEGAPCDVVSFRDSGDDVYLGTCLMAGVGSGTHL